MKGKKRDIHEHVGALLSGYIDGELTQQERQWVEIHCENCVQCRSERKELAAIRKEVAGARLSEVGEDMWGENMKDSTVKASRGIGWILLIAGFLVLAGIVVFEFVTDPTIETHMKLIIAAIYGGVALLLLSVLRQRLIERKSDKYKDVEI